MPFPYFHFVYMLHPFDLFCWKSVEEGKLILKMINAFVHTPENQRYDVTLFLQLFSQLFVATLKYKDKQLFYW